MEQTVTLFMDLDAFCSDVHKKTQVEIDKIKFVVFSEFAKMSSGEISFMDAVENIEFEITPIKKLQLTK